MGQESVELTAANVMIGGACVRGAGPEIRIVDPSTGRTLVNAIGADHAQVEAALAAAHSAFRGWSRTSAHERARVLLGAAERLRADRERLAAQLTREQGKPIAEAAAEWNAALETLEWYAHEGMRAYGRVVPARRAALRQLVERVPVGPVAAFAPWNFPALTPMRKIAGSLAAGCTCVLKAPEETPLSALAIAHAFVEAGLPEGVLSVIFGDAPAIAGQLIDSPVIRKVSFTGSTAIGEQLAARAAKRAVRCTLELGGHAPVIVFADADLERVIAQAGAAKFRNAGQICIAPTRFIVDASIHDEFVERLTDYAISLRVGAGLDPATQLGPVATERRQNALDAMLASACADGAEAARGAVPAQGFFWPATVVSGLRRESPLLHEEPFGPIAPCIAFDSFDEAIDIANSTRFGLAAYLYSRSLTTTHRAAELIDAGMVGVNTTRVSLPELPFGGVKESGYGSEGGIEGLDAYLITKSISVDYS